MAFCTNCGTQLLENARFCLNCGLPVGATPSVVPGATPNPVPGAIPSAVPAAYYPPAPVVEPLRYDIEGHNLQIAKVHLLPGQEIYAEAGKMIYKSANVDWQTRTTGQSLGQKLIGAIKRKLMGESLFFTYFQATGGQGEVGFAGHYPGKIQVFDLAAGQTIMVQRDGFLFAQGSVTLDIAMVRRLGAGLLGGEGFILQRLTGPGAVFIHAGGDHVDFTLQPGEILQVQTGHLVAFEPTVNYDIQMVGSIRTAVFGGEGLFLTTLTGPGRVILQSMTLERLRHELAPSEHPTAGDEKNPLSALARGNFGSFFSSDD
jgi:uncharacterized protein (TIGR00266 family)